MTKIIALINQKGGVGKTTSSINIASKLAIDGKKTLLIDLDQQGNASQGLGINKPEYTITGSLLGLNQVMTYPVKENLDIIPCDVSFSGIEKELEKPKYEAIKKKIGLHNLLNEFVKTIKGYDVILMDCPPALGFVTVSALVASQYVFIPLIAQLYSISGVKEVLKTIDEVKTNLNPDLKLAGMFFTLYDKRTILAKDLHQDIKELSNGTLLDTVVRKSVALEESPSLGQDIFDYRPDSHGAADYTALTDEIKEILFPGSGTSPKKKQFSKPDKTAVIRQMFEKYLEEGGEDE